MSLAEVKDFTNQIQHDSTRKALEALLEYIDELETAVFRLETVVIDCLLEQAYHLRSVNANYTDCCKEVEEDTDAVSFGKTEGVPEDQPPGDLPKMEIRAWSGDSEEYEEKEEEIS